MYIKLTGAPQSTNHLYKYGRGHFYMTKEGRELKESYQKEMMVQWRKPLLKGGVGVMIVLNFNDHRKHDIDNYNKILLDAGTGMLWEDDNQIVAKQVIKRIITGEPYILIRPFLFDITKVKIDE